MRKKKKNLELGTSSGRTFLALDFLRRVELADEGIVASGFKESLEIVVESVFVLVEPSRGVVVDLAGVVLHGEARR